MDLKMASGAFAQIEDTLCPANGMMDSTETANNNTLQLPGNNDPVKTAVTVGTSLLSVAIIIGNGLIIMSVTVVKKLRQPANYLIVSLALSDFLVGLIVLPLTIIYDSGGEWIFGSMICDIHVSFDVICCTASIMNLCMISIDRYLMITKPMTYPEKRKGKLMAFMIAIAWLISCLIIIPALFGFTENVKDSPDWLRHANFSSIYSSQSETSNFTNYEYFSEKNILTQNQTEKFHQWRFSADLGISYKLSRIRYKSDGYKADRLTMLILHAEECEENVIRTEEVFYIQPHQLIDEIFVNQDVSGQYVELTMNVSEENSNKSYGFFELYGEKVRGKTCLISQEAWFTIYSTVGAFYIPLTVMLCMYWKIYREASKFKSGTRRRPSNAGSQNFSELQSQTIDRRADEGFHRSSRSFSRPDVTINNNLKDGKELSKLRSSNSGLFMADLGDDVSLGSSNSSIKGNYQYGNDIIEEDTLSSCCELYAEKINENELNGDSNGKSDLKLNSEVRNHAKVILYRNNRTSSVEDFHSTCTCGRRNQSVPASMSHLNGNGNFSAAVKSRRYSTSVVPNRYSHNNSCSTSFTVKPSRLCNGTFPADSQFQTISEDNVLELQDNELESSPLTSSKNSLTSQRYDSYKTKVSKRNSTNGGSFWLRRSRPAAPRHSIFSGTSVYSSRPPHSRSSMSSGRNGVKTHTNRKSIFEQSNRRLPNLRLNSVAKCFNKKAAVFKNIRRRVSTATSREKMRNVKATRTLGIIVGVFTFCWLPFFIVTFIRPFVCEHPEAQDCIPLVLVRVVLWLGYVNSALNPLIYIGSSADLRKSFYYLLICKCTNVDRRLSQNEVRRAAERERLASKSYHPVTTESIM